MVDKPDAKVADFTRA
jgi:copper chaperone CopZ